MRLARIPPGKRDYCAKYFFEFNDCRRKNFPFIYRCNHEKHVYDACESEE